MRKLVVSILVLVAIGGPTAAAFAQPGLSTGMNTDGIDRNRRIEENQKRAVDKVRKVGLEALQAQNFAVAEKSFESLLEKIPTSSDAHYLMGLAKMGLKKWPEAKQFLEVAILEEPKRPEPKARLAVADIMINDMTGAATQRAELVGLQSQCAGACPDAKLIDANLAMIDKVLAAIAPKPATAPPPAG